MEHRLEHLRNDRAAIEEHLATALVAEDNYIKLNRQTPKMTVERGVELQRLADQPGLDHIADLNITSSDIVDAIGAILDSSNNHIFKVDA